MPTAGHPDSSVLSEKVISAQVKADQAVMSLAAKLNEALEFATDAEKIKSKVTSVVSTIIKLFEQITECCIFIREYTEKGFASESSPVSYKQTTADHLTSGNAVSCVNQEKVAEFIKVLEELRQAVDQGVTIHVGIVTTRMAGQFNILCRMSILWCVCRVSLVLQT